MQLISCGERFQQVMYKVIRSSLKFGYRKSENNFSIKKIYFVNGVTESLNATNTQ